MDWTKYLQEVRKAVDKSFGKKTEPVPKDIFISHSVETMGDHAEQLSELLEEEGYSTFLVSTEERDPKVQSSVEFHASSCKLMVIFLDEAWNDNNECTAEFSRAVSVFNDPKAMILPLLVSGSKWIKPETHRKAHTIVNSYTSLLKGSFSH